MARAVFGLATAGLVGLAAIVTAAPAQARPWNPWPWPADSPVSPGPLYTHPGVYAPDALWDADLRAGRVGPYRDAVAFVPAAVADDRTIVRVWLGSGPRWHRWRHHRHR